MSEQNRAPLYTVDVKYTEEDFRQFIKFYRYSLKKAPLVRMAYVIFGVLLGAVVSVYMENWIYIPIFIVLGLILVGFSYTTDRRATKKYVVDNMNAPSATYTFYDDHIKIKRGGQDNTTVMYHDFYTVIEAESVFYLMIRRDVTLILPKSFCPEGLDDFIRNLDDIKTTWQQSEAERKAQQKAAT